MYQNHHSPLEKFQNADSTKNIHRWREAPKPGPSNYISVAVTFKTGPGGSLLCAFIDGLMEAVEATFTPELLPEEQDLDASIGKSRSFLFISSFELVWCGVMNANY